MSTLAHILVSAANTTVNLWYDGHFTSISVCRVWGAKVRIQVFKREFHTHIHLKWIRLEFLSLKKKLKKIIRCH